eukprot:GFUD01037036.1.p1 GENE.GFUD01037036.1~~GFUD01037036.1.p1  ORF type:complete len:306 (+),score=78.95 GFUD01037036.1:68-919(+)
MSDNNNDHDLSSYAGRCASFGSSTNSFLLKHQDEGFIERMIEEQVKLLGGNKELYNRIDNNMKNGVFDHFFIREHCAIFSWRETFSDKHFPGNSWFTVDLNDEDEFEAEEGNQKFARATIPFQITRHFDRVMALASANVPSELTWLKQQVYFEKNDLLSDEAEWKYKWEVAMTMKKTNGDGLQSLEWESSSMEMEFSDVAHMFAVMYQTGPKKLEEMALKAVLLRHISSGSTSFLPLDYLPKEINKKAATGMYNIEGAAPNNISDEGKEVFERMREAFNKKSS